MFVQIAVIGKNDSRGGWVPQIMLEDNIVLWRGDQLFDSEYEARTVAMKHLTTQLEYILK